MHDDWGITDGYYDVGGAWQATPVATMALLRTAMGTPVAGPPLWFVEAGRGEPLPSACRIRLDDGREIGAATTLAHDLPIGYHELIPLDGGPTTRLIVHPARCPDIPRQWGLAAQIYALCSERSWGIGDLGDLGELATLLRDAGGGAILVSPLHQPAPSFPQSDSPYYPSSRRAWNPLLLAMDTPPPADLTCLADTLIDRDAVWTAKRDELDKRFADIDGPYPVPNTIAMWNALCDELGPEWQEWPDPWRRPDSAALTARLIADSNFAHRARFHQWCQGLIAEQLAEVVALGVDIIGDLAVGFSPDGADAWEYQDLLALEVSVGAPPDPFSTAGQEWGIPPFIPWRVRNAGYEPFINTIRATIRGVQGLRIDHVMGLFRQFWIPQGSKPADGGYVTFPADEMLAIICIEAVRAGAYVVGEDLGTVEPGVRERLAERNVAATRVFWFEDSPPSEWAVGCLATVTTHDLPTVAGVFEGTDGDANQRQRLADLTVAASAVEAIDDVHAALLGAPARLRLLATDDICAATERPNRPGTVGGPNWRRRLPTTVADMTLPVFVTAEAAP